MRPDPAYSPLFRPSALEHSPSLDGPLLIRTPRQGPLLALAALATAIGLLAGLWTGGYSARLSVSGYLAGATPLLHLTATREGRIGRIHVLPGQEVDRGQPLFDLLPGTDSTTLEDLPALRLASLDRQAGLLTDQAQALQDSYRLSQDRIGAEHERLVSREAALGRQREILELQLTREHGNESRLVPLAAQGFLPLHDLESAAARVAQARLSILQLEQELDATGHARRDALRQRAQARAEYRERSLAIETQQALLESRRLELALATPITVHAPRPGRIGEILVTEGTHVQGRQVVLGLQGTGAATQAELAVPARLMSDITAGMPVTLALQDHLEPGRPLIRGTVFSVGATPLPPGMRLGPLSLAEASFRVRVHLSHVPDDIAKPIAAGTHRIVSAQLIGPRHSLLSWVISPLRRLPQAVT